MVADIKGLAVDPVGTKGGVGKDGPVAACGSVGEDDRHELVVEFGEGVFALDVDNGPPGVPFDCVIAPELRGHTLQLGEAAGTGGRLEALEAAEEFVSVPAGPEGQEVTAIVGAEGVGFADVFHVDVIDPRHFCLCLLEIWVRVFVVMWSNIGIELEVAAGEGSDVSAGLVYIDTFFSSIVTPWEMELLAKTLIAITQ